MTESERSKMHVSAGSTGPDAAQSESCEIEGRRVAEPAFWGATTHEFRAVARNPQGTHVAGSVRYKAPHAVDLRIPEHRSALESLTRQLEDDGWLRQPERGQADYNLRFTRPWVGSAGAGRTAQDSSRPGIGNWIDGLTKHTKRLAILLLVGGLAAIVVDVVGGRRLTAEWPSLLSIAVAIVWILAATDDFRMGTHKRIPLRVESEGARHPLAWYRTFVNRVVLPNKELMGWIIPGSMYLVALSYLSGILVQLAAIGALFLLANMFLFLNLRRARDDFVVLAVTQVIVLATNPGGIPSIVRGLGG